MCVVNFYFFCVGILQIVSFFFVFSVLKVVLLIFVFQIFGFFIIGNMMIILFLMFFVFFIIVKEGFDDYCRYCMDEIENVFFVIVLGIEDQYLGFVEKLGFLNRYNLFCIKLNVKLWLRFKEEYDGVSWVLVKWSQVKVGDIVRICCDELVFVDIVFIYSEDENDVVYIDIMVFDGEINFKSKQVIYVFVGCGIIVGIVRCNVEFIIEDLNLELFKFDGYVLVDGKLMFFIFNEVVYCGSVLCNMCSVIGVVINMGEECKLRMNLNQYFKVKKFVLEKVCNVIVIMLVIYVVFFFVGVLMGYVKW